LALGLDAPPLSTLAPTAHLALREFNVDLALSVSEGRGLWFVGQDEEVSAPCAFLAGEALRRAIPILFYPGDELIGRLRRLAAESMTALDNEIYGRLANIEFLVVDGLDAAAAGSRFPEVIPASDEGKDGGRPAGSTKADHASAYRPGMTEADLSRLAIVVNERLMNERATVISTRFSRPLLEEDFLRLPGPRTEAGPNLHDPRRRVQELRPLLSRLQGLCDSPLSVAATDWDGGSVRVRRQAGKSAAKAPRNSLMSSN
jgi:hypothetical protein